MSSVLGANVSLKPSLAPLSPGSARGAPEEGASTEHPPGQAGKLCPGSVPCRDVLLPLSSPPRPPAGPGLLTVTCSLSSLPTCSCSTCQRVYQAASESSVRGRGRRACPPTIPGHLCCPWKVPLPKHSKDKGLAPCLHHPLPKPHVGGHKVLS